MIGCTQGAWLLVCRFVIRRAIPCRNGMLTRVDDRGPRCRHMQHRVRKWSYRLQRRQQERKQQWQRTHGGA